MQLHSILLVSSGPLHQGHPTSSMTTEARGHGIHDTTSIGNHISMLIQWQLHDLVKTMIACAVLPDLPAVQHMQ